MHSPVRSIQVFKRMGMPHHHAKRTILSGRRHALQEGQYTFEMQQTARKHEDLRYCYTYFKHCTGGLLRDAGKPFSAASCSLLQEAPEAANLKGNFRAVRHCTAGSYCCGVRHPVKPQVHFSQPRIQSCKQAAPHFCSGFDHSALMAPVTPGPVTASLANPRKVTTDKPNTPARAGT